METYEDVLYGTYVIRLTRHKDGSYSVTLTIGGRFIGQSVRPFGESRETVLQIAKNWLQDNYGASELPDLPM
jgi:hypothetical protein